jgi:uracil-DNA glycosylase family protein
MPVHSLAHEADWTGWRRAARGFVLAGVEPAGLTWIAGGNGDAAPEIEGGFTLSRALVALAAQAFQAREPERFGLLYTLVWRAHHGGIDLTDQADLDLRLARYWALAVRADAHRMRTNARFIPMASAGGPGFLGWYRPDHFVLEANARLLARRDPANGFTIVTPDGLAHWDRRELRFGAGLKNPGDDDTLLAWWDAHHDAILAASNQGGGLPEAEELDEAPRPPDHPPLGPAVLAASETSAAADLVREARGCERCELHLPATQTVFGEGPRGAPVMFVGEQPGDQEDVIGRPFVGPAGQLLDQALEEAGIDRRLIYITNAVKHFKFVPRGRRRIHQSPSPQEIEICRFWLDAERTAVDPALIVLLGGSAGRAVLGRPVAVTRERGRPFDLPDGGTAFLTVHPSYLLRQPDEVSRAREYAAFVRDLRAVRELIDSLPGRHGPSNTSWPGRAA